MIPTPHSIVKFNSDQKTCDTIQNTLSTIPAHRPYFCAAIYIMYKIYTHIT